MNDGQLAHFLIEAGKNLSTLDLNDFSSATVGQPNSAICILDNVREEGAEDMANRQRVRSSTEIEAIFVKASLRIDYTTKETVVHGDFGPMRIWLLS